jgi:hypothetical protein
MTKVYVDPMTGKSDKHLYSFCFDVKYFLSYFLEKVIFLKTFLAFGSYKKKINDEKFGLVGFQRRDHLLDFGRSDQFCKNLV